jgi:hypothetical protein
MRHLGHVRQHRESLDDDSPRIGSPTEHEAADRDRARGVARDVPATREQRQQFACDERASVRILQNPRASVGDPHTARRAEHAHERFRVGDIPVARVQDGDVTGSLRHEEHP